ncbi:hypothetical protein [Celeribacter indicus]|uniref:Uncharacterized protein n=1 Tax=Celeribacter indicus TaxID=1208324 RepID=A0A0B5E0K3_9RHOB|nr:hypothetical protein [Celeribacter indicus]AJE46950.1 hypothetical protein P73_2235 [Celeribacter indicus]SDW77858.1 hypothetical protein SAMN05443573_10725 [Celeribacter indicus]
MSELRWLLRAKRWAQRPPSAARVRLVLVVIALCLALFAVERTAGLPDWMQVNGKTRVKVTPASP